LTRTWTKVTGPGTVTFGNANSASTTASFSTAGIYTLRLTASDGSLTTTDDVVVEVIPAMVPTNAAPMVNVGPNLSVELPNTLNLSGTVTDDGLPTAGTLTLQWTATGPGNAQFGNATSANTSAQFSTAGTYTLRLTAFDGEYTVFDELTVVVGEAPAPPAPSPRRKYTR
jgi:PKD repeat protein